METLYRAGLSNAVSATVLALVVACLGRVLGRRPAVLHCLWLLVLLKLVTPPLYEVSIPWPQGSIAPRETLSAPLVVHSERAPDTAQPLLPDNFVVNHLADFPIAIDSTQVEPADSWLGEWPSIDWMRLACLIWIAGILTTLVVSFGRIRRFQGLLSEARPASDDRQAQVDELAVSLGLERSPSVWWTDGKLPPLVWSLGRRPRMIIPSALWKGLSDDQRSTLIIHELAHLCRGDHHVRIFELLVTALYWWHPVVWWARKALRDVEEQCCDAWVVWSCPNAAKSYAETLLETLDFLNQSDLSEPLLASGFGRVHHLRKRLTMIMNGTTPRLVGLWGTLGSLGLAAALLPVNPTWAQPPEVVQEVRVVVKNDTETPQEVTLFKSDTDDTITAVATAAGTTNDIKSDQFHFEFKTDDSPAIVGGSVDEALKKINEQLATIEKDSHPSDKTIARKKALEGAVEQLKMIAKKDKDGKGDKDKQKLEKVLRKVVIRHGDEDKNISSETKAEIEKATAQVKKLADELRSKQKELVEAKTKLARLSTGRGRGQVRVVENMKLDVHVKEMTPMMKPLVGLDRHAIVVRRDAEPGQKRIDDLEKKLEKLLEEVASLKKDRTK